jgi:hypothetical protein
MMLAVEPVPEVLCRAALKYDHEKVVDTVCRDNPNHNPDYDLLVPLDTNAQEEVANADFEDCGTGDIANLSNPPALKDVRTKIIRLEFLGQTFMPITKFALSISQMCRPVP